MLIKIAGGDPLVGRGWPSKPPRWPGVAFETPSLAGGGLRNPLVGRGWPSKPPRWPGVAFETPSIIGLMSNLNQHTF